MIELNVQNKLNKIKLICSQDIIETTLTTTTSQANTNDNRKSSNNNAE